MRRWLPVVVLLLLAPAVPELLGGSTPVTRVFPLFIVEIGLYGCGALLIREVARRRGMGWAGILLLAAAYAVVEEALVDRTWFEPTWFTLNLSVFGRALGVNWLMVESLTVLHVIWSIATPIVLTELLFPDRRDEPWLGRVGVAVSAAVYVLVAVGLGAFFALRSDPGYVTPPLLLAGSALLAAALVVAALVLPAPAPRTGTRPAPSPWLVAALGLAVTVPWLWLQLPGPGLVRGLIRAAFVAAVVVAVWRASASDRRWDDRHLLALSAGPLMAFAVHGHGIVTRLGPGSGLAVIVQWALTAAAAIGVVLLAWMVSRRDVAPAAASALRSRRT